MKRIIYLFTLMGLFLISSCISSKKSVYVGNMVPDSIYLAKQAMPLLAQTGDRLRIVISARNAELAAPFNNVGGSSKVDERGQVSSSGSQELARGYLVDQQGQISFPVLGNVLVGGHSLADVKALIEEKLVEQRLLQQPSATVELENLKINVIGEVTRVGVVDVPDGRITLFDAIAKAGGLTVNGSPTDVTIIREEDGHRRLIAANLESQEVFESAGYYLQQNDIVYVKPKGRRMSPNEEANFRYVSVGVGLLSLVLTFVNLLVK
ncbi:polysaccharide biosynthesis/export family protein [Sphingobacterium ginsenosidimutans]|uniref:Polysaccharide biosynthesis/export family protein n=1 Tax=Sphingobacterium ginsenosidimutans TaxID=687845 RepID=A0ABP7ZQM3_9SPHI